MAAILQLTTGQVYLVNWSGTITGGSLTLTGSVAGADGTAALPSYTFANNTNRGFFNDTTNNGIGVTFAGVQSGYLASSWVMQRPSLGTTSTDGIVLQNTTMASAGTTVQKSPRLRFISSAYNSVSTLGETDTWAIEVAPTSVAGATNSQITFSSSINGGGTTIPFSISSSGGFNLLSGGFIVGGSKGVFVFDSSVDGGFRFQNNAGTSGFGLDGGSTDGTAKLRNRSFTAGTGNLDIGGKLTAYNNVSTAGWGTPAIQAAGRTVAATNATVASVSAYTVGAADGSFEVSANVNVTAATTANMTVTCAYTDETNAARTLTLGFTQLTGSTLLSNITNVTGTGPYESLVYHIRCKTSTSITIATAGTVTGITYNVEGIIKQTA